MANNITTIDSTISTNIVLTLSSLKTSQEHLMYALIHI